MVPHNFWIVCCSCDCAICSQKTIDMELYDIVQYAYALKFLDNKKLITTTTHH